MESEPANLAESDPRRHALALARACRELAEQAKDDVMKVEDPAARTMFETSAEILIGLAHAQENFVQGAPTGPTH